MTMMTSWVCLTTDLGKNENHADWLSMAKCFHRFPVRAWVNMCVAAWTHTCRGQKTTSGAVSLEPSTLLWGGGGLSLACYPANRLHQLASNPWGWDLPIFTSQRWEHNHAPSHQIFSCGFQSLNTGPQACTDSSLLTVLSPQPMGWTGFLHSTDYWAFLIMSFKEEVKSLLSQLRLLSVLHFKLFGMAGVFFVLNLSHSNSNLYI